jgi:hypothetical protein
MCSHKPSSIHHYKEEIKLFVFEGVCRHRVGFRGGGERGVEVQVIEFAACLLLVLWRALDLAGADVALGRDTGDGLGVLRL